MRQNTFLAYGRLIKITRAPHTYPMKEWKILFRLTGMWSSAASDYITETVISYGAATSDSDGIDGLENFSTNRNDITATNRRDSVARSMKKRLRHGPISVETSDAAVDGSIQGRLGGKGWRSLVLNALTEAGLFRLSSDRRARDFPSKEKHSLGITSNCASQT